MTLPIRPDQGRQTPWSRIGKSSRDRNNKALACKSSLKNNAIEASPSKSRNKWNGSATCTGQINNWSIGFVISDFNYIGLHHFDVRAIIKALKMNLLKRSELLLLKEQNLLPAIPMPAFAPCERVEKSPMDRKESDFIKRLKKTKSIMIAQKNRKQKTVLNPYFMDSRKRKSNQSLVQHCNSNSLLSSPKNYSIDAQEQKLEKLERFLFPPVHSSIQICLNTSKKLASRELKIDSLLYQPVNVGEYLLQKTKEKNVKRIGIARTMEEKQLKMKEKKIDQSQTERQILNYTEAEAKENPENGYKSQKKLLTMKPYIKAKINRKEFKYYRNLTEESKNLNEHEKLMGWEFRSGDDYPEML